MIAAASVVAPLGIWDVVGRLADGVTLVAALLALLALHPLCATWRTRPRIEIRTTSQTTGVGEVQVLHRVGSVSAARNFIVNWAVLDEDNISQIGDGHAWMDPGLVPFSAVRTEIIEGEPIGATPDYSNDWMKVRVAKGNGFIMEASWQRPLRSWLRESRVVLWTQSDRSQGLPPRVANRREAKRASHAALSGQPVSRK